jgi:hypothetical protein
MSSLSLRVVADSFRHALGALLLAGASALASAEAPSFDLPIACHPGRDCFIQNLYDHDAGPQWQDYACGSLSYDTHTGTDFRVRTIADMERGVAVLAAAAGTVKSLRDGEPDISVKERGKARVKGREAGNGVVLDHGDGWETQYSHLKRGSIRVRKGEVVEAGKALGLVGLSGNTEFPHVDFTVRRNGVALDPFAPAGRAACGPQAVTLWSAAVAVQLAYQPSGVLQAGWAGAAPNPGEIAQGRLPAVATTQSEAMIYWVEVFGLRKGDVQRFEMLDPEGRILLVREIPAARNFAAHFSHVGVRRPPEGWAPGRYKANYRLLRGVVVSEYSSDFLLEQKM